MQSKRFFESYIYVISSNLYLPIAPKFSDAGRLLSKLGRWRILPEILKNNKINIFFSQNAENSRMLLSLEL